MARILNRDFAGVMAQQPLSGTAAILKRGGYYEDSEWRTHARGIGQFTQDYIKRRYPHHRECGPEQCDAADVCARAVQDGIRQSNTNRNSRRRHKPR